MSIAGADRDDIAELSRLFAADDGLTPLGWEGVRAFEARHGIGVPEPYRSFVAEIADGSRLGPPAYGLLRLSELPSDWGTDRPDRDLAAPFPLTKAWIWEGDDDLTDEDLVAALHPVYDHGSIVLGTDGCGLYWHLVVTGEQRGSVWGIADVGAAPEAPDFLTWVRAWAAH